jgi:hypothetical protein
MQNVVVPTADERPRRHEGESLSARSPLSDAEKEAIVRAEYFPTAHRIGIITSLIHVVIFFLPPLYLTLFYGLRAEWGTIMQGAAAAWSFSMPLWFIEPVSYFLVLGICGTYISFLAGNISNFRLPVSAVAQEVAQVEEGSHEGEIISALAIAATQIMITLSALTGAIFVSAMVGLLPVTVVAAFDWLLPSIWGAIVVQCGLRNWRYAVVAVTASIVVVSYSGLPTWSHTPVLVALMVALALFTHNRGIWVPKGKDAEALTTAGGHQAGGRGCMPS